MNFTILQDLVIANLRASKVEGLRTKITLPLLYSKRDGHELKKHVLESFYLFLKKHKIDEAEIKILQFNAMRARIVFEYFDRKDNTELIIKWVGVDIIGGFNFVGSIKNEVDLHKNILSMIQSDFIPKYINHGEDHIVVEKIIGKPLINYIYERDILSIRKAINILLGKLNLLYTKTVTGKLTALDFNQLVDRDVNYFQSTRGGLKIDAILVFLITPPNAQNLYQFTIDSVCELFSNLDDDLSKHMTIRDLDEHNLIYNQNSDNIYAVDMEDASYGHYVFDISYLTARLLMGARPIDMYHEIIPIVDDWITCNEKNNADSIIGIYRALMTKQLIISAMNPWLWLSKDTFHREKNTSIYSRYRWLKDIWEIIHLECNKTKGQKQ